MVHEHFGRTDAYVSHLIRRKARSLCRYLGLSRSHTEDFEHELWLHLLERQHRFDPTIAKFETFADRLIENKVRSIIRFHRAQKRDIQREAFSLNEMINSDDDDSIARHETIPAGGEDVFDIACVNEQTRMLMDALDPDDQLILRLRLRGHSKLRIAIALGLSRRQIDKAMTRIGAAAKQLKISPDDDCD